MGARPLLPRRGATARLWAVACVRPVCWRRQASWLSRTWWAEDHAHARMLAEAIAEIPGLRIDPSTVMTDIVIFDVIHPTLTPAEISARLQERGVRINAISATQMRAVTHYGIERRDIEQAIEALRGVLSSA